MNRDGSRPSAISVAVLAGGESTRMGSNKALKMLGGKQVISHVIDSLAPMTSDIFIVSGDVAAYENLTLPVCADQYPQRASLVGVYSALAASRNRYCFAVACDMPFTEPMLVGRLASLVPGYDAVVPVSQRGNEPLHAIYSRDCLEHMRDQIENGVFSMSEMLAGLRVRYVELAEMIPYCDPDMVFINVNTVVDLDQASLLVPYLQKKREAAHAGASLQDGPPLICFVGRKDSGKTTFLEKLIPELGGRGVKVACIKHDLHGFTMDREGTDTWRLSQAGAKRVMISSPWAMAALETPAAEKSLAELYAAAGTDVDLVIAEGFKTAAADKIEVCRGGREGGSASSSGDGSLACREEELVAVVSDQADVAGMVPVFEPDDVAAIANLIMIRYGLGEAAAAKGAKGAGAAEGAGAAGAAEGAGD